MNGIGTNYCWNGNCFWQNASVFTWSKENVKLQKHIICSLSQYVNSTFEFEPFGEYDL